MRRAFSNQKGYGPGTPGARGRGARYQVRNRVGYQRQVRNRVGYIWPSAYFK